MTTKLNISTKSGDTLCAFRADPVRFLNHLAESGEAACHFNIGRHRLTLLTEPAAIEELLVAKQKSFKKGPGLLRLRPLLGNGLLTADGDHHRYSRQLIAPIFRRERLQQYGFRIEEILENITSTWHDGATIDVQQEMIRITLDAILATVFSSPQLAEPHSVAEDVRSSIQATYRPLSRCPFDDKSPESSAYLNKTVDLLLNQWEEGQRGTDLVSVLKAGEGTDDDVRDEVMTFLLAGHESVATALTWAWYALSQNENVRQKLELLIAEAHDTRSDQKLTTYLNMIVTESLRLFPPAWMFSRQAIETVKIGENEYPPGSILIAAPIVTHRDERHWDRALMFDPERWSPKRRDQSRPKYAYFPFGGGGRRCIGEQFALNEIAIVLRKIVENYRLDLEPGALLPVFDPVVTLRPLGSVRMVVTRRGS